MVAITKARDIDAFLAKPDFSKKIILLFGPDQGLVAERADQLAAKTGVDLKDPFSLIRLDAEDAAADSARIADEAHTIGMFGGSRLIRISGTTRRDLTKGLKPVLDTPPEDAIILIEAGDLRKTAGLYKQLSASKAAVCIACYQDNDAALEQLINEEIESVGLQLDRDTRAELKSLLGNNRMASRGELAKLALYCHGKVTVALEDVRAIVGDAGKLVIDDVVDAVAIGNTSQLQKKLPKAIESDHSPDMIIQAVIRQFQMLQVGRSKMENQRQSAGSIVSGMRPPVHFSRKDLITRALSLWTLARLGRALSRLDRTMLDCRKHSDTSASLAGTTLLAICLEASALGKRR